MSDSYTSNAYLPDYELWQRAKRIPMDFDIEITPRCNNDCTHCYINLPAGDETARAAELTLTEIDHIASQAVQLGALWCLVSGGEPLLRKDFNEIYVLLKRKGLLVSVFTNACLVTPEHVALFKKYPPRDIEVTVYGATEATYERVTRKKGSFAAFRRGLKLLLDAGLKVRLKAMALRSNAHELPEIARFCREFTSDYFRFDPQLHLRYDGNAERNAEIRAERLSPAEVVALEQADDERREKLETHCAELITAEMEHDCNHLFHCGAGMNSFSVTYDGKFRLCSSLHHPDTLYDLRAGTLAEAWNDFVPRVRDLRSDDPQFLAGCRVCPISNLCLWCPAHAHLESGRMDAWNAFFCEVAHARADSIMKGAHQLSADSD